VSFSPEVKKKVEKKAEKNPESWGINKSDPGFAPVYKQFG
jgi:hypothetical protein